MSVCLLDCLSGYLSVHLSVRPSIYLSVLPYVCPSFHMCVLLPSASVCLSICPSRSVSIVCFTSPLALATASLCTPSLPPHSSPPSFVPSLSLLPPPPHTFPLTPPPPLLTPSLSPLPPSPPLSSPSRCYHPSTCRSYRCPPQRLTSSL